MNLSSAKIDGFNPAKRVLLAFIAFVGFDFFFHGGLIAYIHARPNPAVLSAKLLFYRIPFGYASFLFQIVGLELLMQRLRVESLQSGFWVGGLVGSFVGVSWSLAFYSYLTLPIDQLVAIGICQAVELALSGAVIGAMLGGAKARWMATLLICMLFFEILFVVILQSAGLAPLPT